MNKQKVFGIMVVILFIVLIAIDVSKGGSEEFELELMFAPEVGKVYHFDMTMEQKITQELEGEEMEIEQTMGFGFRIEATEIDEDGNMWIDSKYEWVQVKQSSDFAEIEFDSREPSNGDDPLAVIYSALLGNGYSMQVSPAGDILEITGFESLISEMMNKSGIEDEALIAQFKEQFSEDALKEQSGGMFIEFPEGALKIGDTWTVIIPSTSIAPLIIDTTYILKSYEDGIATIEAASTINTDPDQSEVDMGMYIMRYNLSGTQEGTIYVDTATGWTLSAAVTQTLSGEMTMIMGEEEITVPLSATSIVEIEIYEE